MMVSSIPRAICVVVTMPANGSLEVNFLYWCCWVWIVKWTTSKLIISPIKKYDKLKLAFNDCKMKSLSILMTNLPCLPTWRCLSVFWPHNVQ